MHTLNWNEFDDSFKQTNKKNYKCVFLDKKIFLSQNPCVCSKL